MSQSSDHTIVTDFQRLCTPMLDRIDKLNEGTSAGLVAQYLEKLAGDCVKKTLVLLKEKNLMRKFFVAEKDYVKV